jgi:membrane associated rhomboid family serine protease
MADRLAGMLPGRGSPVTPRGGKPGVSLAQVARAMVMMAGFLAMLWVIQLANWADSYRLDVSFGILPRSESHLADILIAPFLHFSWQHLEGNSIPLLVLGFLAAYRGVAKFLAVTAIAVVTSGLTVWLFQAGNELTVGASGLIFGYFGYVVVRGLFDRNFVDAIVGVIAAIAYAYILAVAIPGTPGVSWLGHAGGLAGGVLAGWVLRVRRRRAAGTGAASGSSPIDGTGSLPKGGGTGGTGGFASAPANPRAGLHKELDDMGI